MKRKAYEMSDSGDESEEETYEEAPIERTDFEDKTFLTGQSVVVGTVALEELVSDDTEAWIIKVPRNVRHALYCRNTNINSSFGSTSNHCC